MKRFAGPVLFLCGLLTSFSPLCAQNGPDNDPDAMPGYTKSIFHHSQIDSINLYNGGLTIPIALGPSYPVGPKLRFQAALTYNSTVWEFGNPGPNNQSDLGLYEPIKADPSLGVGWGLSAGAIKLCGVVQNSNCYVGQDGAEHIFESSPSPNYYKTSDATQFLLHFINSTAGYEMWDGEGNHYVFAWHVTGYDDLPQDFLNDLGRGRNGWYLTALTDPFGNGITVTYYTSLGSQPCWTPAHCPTATNSWIVRNVKRGSTTLMTVNLGTDPGAPSIGNLVTSLDFAVAGGGTARWTLSHGTVLITRGEPNLATLNLVTISSVQLPVSVQYSFTWNTGPSDGGYGGLMRTMALPTGGVISYVWGAWSFYHGRTASININCFPIGPPNDADTKQSGRAAPGQKTNFPDESIPEEPAISGNDCSLTNPNRWLDRARGVIRRTETVGGVDSMTDYAQYAFPFGERGTVSNSFGPQTLTLVTMPVDVDMHRTSTGTLFWGALPGSPSGGGTPGGRVGADIRLATYDSDPYPGLISPFSQPLCGGTADALCVTHAIRVAQRTFEYDSPPAETRNRRLKSETTYFDNTNADGTCPGCAYHTTSFSNTGSNTWEGNGRHYNLETHSGNLGGDSRTITTDWAAQVSPWLPNLYNQHTETQGSTIRDQYFEFDTTNGFLKGSFTYDAARDIAFVSCRYNDGLGNLDTELTKTLSSASPPARTYCSNNYPAFPSPVGVDGDLYGKDYGFQNGRLLTARWVNGSLGTPTFYFRNSVRDGATGWVTTSSDTSGLATLYSYDLLGRVVEIDPPSATELKTRICYDSPTSTTAYRASTALTCPVAATNPAVASWQHYDYDGLGRLIREQRLQPAGALSKRFTLFDGTGHGYFHSEWVASTTPEAVNANLATACVFAGGNAATSRPSSAPGTYRMCWDPFGRPQQIVGSKHSSLATIDRADGATPYSDTKEALKTYCVNGTFTSLQSASCSAGASSPVTTTRRDAVGRTTSVAEPTGDVTSYAYDINGKLTSVTQGAQSRMFGYDFAGFLRSETTPEGGTVTYDTIGSVGNVRQETRPGGVIVTRRYDFAGRTTEEDAGGNKYVVSCYDGSATCVDGSPGYVGGPYPKGKMTRRYGYNRIPTVGPIADESFEYADSGGRLSKLTTSIGNGDLASATVQTWTYGNLGLVSDHYHPRAAGTFRVTNSYIAGLTSAIAAGSQNVVTAATYNPAAGLASWTAGNSGTAIITTILPDPSMLPRPASISNPFWSTGVYTYDGAGNILRMGSADNFTYDSRSRLLSAQYSSSTRAFNYDRYGNLTQSGGTLFDIDAAHNQLKPTNAGSPAYDLRGNLTYYNGDTMSYDLLDRQYRVGNGGSDWVYLFNGAGERLAKFPTRFSVLRREMARYVAEANVIAKGWTLPACVQIFTDVSCSDPDAKHIKLVYDKGITAGCNSNPLQYCPDASLTRAQMAVFLVKGYKADGFAPPACQGTFQDVTCSGSYASYAPWIEQLYRDGVTSGCNTSPLQFCPGNTVGEWEMLVWLAKAPGSPPGTTFWSAYHPIPRGSIYTWRDEQNRVVTESAAGLTGASTASLSVTRDNVFFGNLLVASYVASPAGWQYTASDHLGSPRVVFNQSGALVETHKYWPYGEDTNPSPPNQHLAYCVMERDDGAAHFYDHARTHDYNLGRFLSPDRIGGHPANPQSWNRYAYTLGNPMKHVDPDGKLTIVVHGTGARGSKDFMPGGTFFEYVVKTVPDRAYASFQWSGANNHQARIAAAHSLAAYIRAYKFAPGEPLNIIGHSHGGNSGITAVNLDLGHKVTNLVTMGTPSRPGYHLLDPSAVGRFVNVFNSHDGVQSRGGGDYSAPFEIGPAARTQPFALNINWNLDQGVLGSHSALHTPAVWDFTLPHLELTPTERAFTPQRFVWQQ